jgi:uncharacterized membrane protein YphA (DoxX/SURF4 family)
VLAVVALVALRLGVGWQFFREGADKIHNGFSSAGFFGAAKGPLAPLYRSMLPDPDGQALLEQERAKSAWNAYAEAAIEHYGYGDDREMMHERSILERKRKIEEDAKQIKSFTDDINRLNRKIEGIRKQKVAAEAIVATAEAALDTYFEANQEEIHKYRQQLQRRRRNEASEIVQVASLRGQAERTEAELRKDRAKLLGPIEALWNDVERSIASLATDEQLAAKGELTLTRPGSNVLSTRLVDAVVPWLDLAIGALLIVGLFTRVAAVAGAAFLGSIVLTQWPWSIGAAPIYYQVNLMLALLVLAALGAGRYGGLDYFCGLLCSRCCRAKTNTTPARQERPS